MMANEFTSFCLSLLRDRLECNPNAALLTTQVNAVYEDTTRGLSKFKCTDADVETSFYDVAVSRGRNKTKHDYELVQLYKSLLRNDLLSSILCGYISGFECVRLVIHVDFDTIDPTLSTIARLFTLKCIRLRGCANATERMLKFTKKVLPQCLETLYWECMDGLGLPPNQRRLWNNEGPSSLLKEYCRDVVLRGGYVPVLTTSSPDKKKFIYYAIDSALYGIPASTTNAGATMMTDVTRVFNTMTRVHFRKWRVFLTEYTGAWWGKQERWDYLYYDKPAYYRPVLFRFESKLYKAFGRAWDYSF